MAGIYNADIYCDDCIDEIKRRIARELVGGNDRSGMLEFLLDEAYVGVEEDVTEVVNILDSLSEIDYDSDDYPKWCSSDAESDGPEHCGSGPDCINAEELSGGSKCGYFFENSLTSDGANYVLEAVNEDLLSGCAGGVAIELWKPCYDYLDYHEQCEECGSYGELSCTTYGVCIPCEEAADDVEI